MARVPTYDSFQVGAEVLPQPRMQLPAALDTAGQQASQIGVALGNTGNEANFAFDVSGPYTARGAFLISASNKGSTTGVLMAATRFATDRAGLNSPDNLGVRYVITATDAA